jgi:hypothetical protein
VFLNSTARPAGCGGAVEFWSVIQWDLTAMSSTWKHPSLGDFVRNGSTFSTNLTVPAFRRFSYDTGYSNARRSTGKVSLSFGPWMMNETLAEPTPDMVTIAEKLLADPDKLVDSVAQALWEEFNGRGPSTGIWWYGGMDYVSESFRAGGLSPPTNSQDVLPALQLTCITIFTHLWDHPHPIAVLSFYAAFEREHDLCVVSDGDRVLGTGFSGEPQIGKHPSAGTD